MAPKNKDLIKKKAIIVIVAGDDEELAASEHAFEKYSDYLMDIGVRFFGARDLPDVWEEDSTHTEVGDAIDDCRLDVEREIEEYEDVLPDELDNPTIEEFTFQLAAWGGRKFRIGSLTQVGDDKRTFAFLDVFLTHHDGGSDGQWLPFGTTPVDDLKVRL